MENKRNCNVLTILGKGWLRLFHKNSVDISTTSKVPRGWQVPK